VTPTQQMSTAQEDRRIGHLGPRVVRIAGIVGLLGLGGSVAIGWLQPGGPARFYEAYLVNYCYLLSLSLGAMFFVLLHHVTRSGWSVVVRRLAEIIMGNVVLLIPLCIPIILGLPYLYHWMNLEAMAHDEVLLGKRPYLNETFFLIRLGVYFICWAWIGRYFLKRSLEQDDSGEIDLTLRMERWSGPATVVFAFTATFASFDLIMSLDAHWYSTIFGVYFFAGSAVGFFSLLALVTMWLQARGRLTASVTVEHYHDIGKWIFTFIFFWGYIGFSQYMLIWYADLPEETRWTFARQTGTWMWVALAILFGHFCVPFTVMLSRIPKRRLVLLAFFAAWMLVMHWIDVWWMITPRLSPGEVRFDWLHATSLIGLGGLYIAGLAYQAMGRSLRPEKDPRLPESLAFENV
jgi:hypothetical protein